MMNNSSKPLASMWAFLRLVAVACWSVAQLSAWFVASTVGYIYAIWEACQEVDARQSDMSIMYNSLNYPDEVAPLT